MIRTKRKNDVTTTQPCLCRLRVSHLRTAVILAMIMALVGMTKISSSVWLGSPVGPLPPLEDPYTHNQRQQHHANHLQQNHDNHQHHDQREQEQHDEQQVPATAEPCALLFFGLPRAFEKIVLPSVIQYILLPNSHYECDIYVHYFHVEEEAAGRMNSGGTMDPNAILLLERAAHDVATNHSRRIPIVSFDQDDEDSFLLARNASLHKYMTTVDTRRGDGNWLYFPWQAKSYQYPSSIHNIVQQWHSIERVWQLMESHAAARGIQYSRVAMFRSDVMYVLPVDIYQRDKDTVDYHNNYAVFPAFAMYPVNDRMIYGPYSAVQVWATERFRRIDHHALVCEPGKAMHSETFLDHSIFTPIRDSGVEIVANPNICFFRVRANLVIYVRDCQTPGGIIRGIQNRTKKDFISDLVGLPCGPARDPQKFHVVLCNDSDTTELR